MALSAGTRLGPYEILSKVGAGGMGEVYKARDTRLGRMVAIKILPPGRVADKDRQRRFEQEAIAASALNHPNIVTVYDVGAQDGLAFLAMELVSGKSLDQSIPASGMRIGEILRVASQIADALSMAHANGIVHRDLKPANVMITAEGLVKVLDFGLAKVTQSAEGEDAETRTIAGLTDAGTVLGTAAYMSPEQTEGKPVDGRSDIFAFGSLLYEMATGQRAFQGGTPISTMSSVLRDDPPSCDQVRADLPPQLARVIARCLRKDPARRFQHMADLKVELDDLKQESDSGKLNSTNAAVSQPSRSPVWIAVAAFAAAAGFLGYRFLQARATISPEPPTRVTVASAPAPTEAPAAPGKAIDKPPAPAAQPPPQAPSQAPEVQETPKAKAAYDQGMLLIDQQKPAEAVPHFDDSIRANPNFLAAYLGRAEARRQTGQYETSIEDCNRALQLAPQDARAYFCRGLGEAFLEQYDLTVRDDTEAIRINPDFVLAYQGRGNAYNNLQQYDRAAADFTEAIRIRPNNGQFYLRRAGIYEKLQQYPKAIQDYDEAIRLQPGNARAYNGRANAKKRSGDGRGAEADRRLARQLKEQ
jgi:serine/threonine protein kinase/Tfp pilus assembly protein PilF